MVYWTGTTALEGNDGHRREKQDHRAVCTLPQRAHACGEPAERPAGVAFGARGGGPHGPAHGGPRPGPYLPGAGGPIGGRPALFGVRLDEGGAAGGPNGPYYQSGRTGLYAEALAQLEKKGLLYPCFCTRAQLHAAEAPHNSDGETIYSGRCRGLTTEQIEAQARLARPGGAAAAAGRDRAVCGWALWPCGTKPGARNAGTSSSAGRTACSPTSWPWCWTTSPWGVTQVVRGRDLLSSTPRQMYLYRLFGASPPQYIHVPLLLARDGRRLSKREHDLDLGALRAHGFSGEGDRGPGGLSCGGFSPIRVPPARATCSPCFPGKRLPKENLVLPEDLFRDAQ